MALFLSQLAYPHFHAICLTLVCAATLGALIAIWAGTSRRHWFWRALAVWAGAVALVPVRAYELAAIMAISLPATALTVRMIERFAERRDLGGRGSRRAESR